MVLSKNVLEKWTATLTSSFVMLLQHFALKSITLGMIICFYSSIGRRREEIRYESFWSISVESHFGFAIISLYLPFFVCLDLSRHVFGEKSKSLFSWWFSTSWRKVCEGNVNEIEWDHHLTICLNSVSHQRFRLENHHSIQSDIKCSCHETRTCLDFEFWQRSFVERMREIKWNQCNQLHQDRH